MHTLPSQHLGNKEGRKGEEMERRKLFLILSYVSTFISEIKNKILPFFEMGGGSYYVAQPGLEHLILLVILENLPASQVLTESIPFASLIFEAGHFT